MLSADNYVHDAASALSLGRRDRQEDAVAADFALGSEVGFAVLSDGMGGHAAGDLASGIVVTEVFSELKMLTDDPTALERNIHQVLHNAVTGANRCVELYARQNPEARGLGATLVVPVLFSNRLYWISVGDSPLFLFRDGQLTRLNEDHSMSSYFDQMSSQGLISLDEAQSHPDRNCLTSVLAGMEVPRIDCRDTPFGLLQNDVLIVASDGLQFLSDAQIADILNRVGDQSSARISAMLLSEVEKLGNPDQDNVSLCVIKLDRFQPEWTAGANDQAAPEPNHTAPPRNSARFVRAKVSSTGNRVQAVFQISKRATRP